MSMLVVVALVTGFAYWDEQREAKAALDDFAAEQSTFASSLAAGLSAYLAALQSTAVTSPTAPPDLEGAMARAASAVSRVAHPGESVVVIQAPGSTELRTTDGRAVRGEAFALAYQAGLTSVRLTREQAAALGLPERTAYAGLASVEAGGRGSWRIAAVTTARRVRDRQIRAGWRLVLSVAVASGLVLVFGGIALRNQRKELELQRELAVMAVQSERDERLARATRAAVMGTFAMGITHEVSTPLGVILGRAEQVLGRVSGDERAAHAARVIIDQAERLRILVRTFLDLARGGAPNFARVDSSSIVSGAVALVDHRFRKVGVDLVLDVPAELPMVQCDRSLLEHALVNLLLNACEACQAGGKVTVNARADGAQVGFIVTDDGAGIKPEDAARATEPFFTTKPEGQGTGLGLAIASEIVKSHRGTLTIEPCPSQGTRALIEVPVAPDEVRRAA
jgi:two-component system NtrC family sensor kinase